VFGGGGVSGEKGEVGERTLFSFFGTEKAMVSKIVLAEWVDGLEENTVHI